MIVSPTHQQGNNVTEEVRRKLQASGLIGKKEVKVRKLQNLNLTEAQKTDWRNFQAGQKVQFNQNVPRIKRGSIWTVTGSNELEITIEDENKQENTLPNNKAEAYDVYRETEISLSKGDQIRLTRNAFDKDHKRLNNGQHLEVAAVSKKGNIVLQNKASKTRFELNKDFGHIDHAYCTTSHSAQGKTVDEVFISQPSSTFTATDAKQFYVSVSRGRDKATIYTDDRVALLEYASELGDRRSALELVGNNVIHLDHIQQIERNMFLNKNEQSENKSKNYNLDKDDHGPGL